MTSPDPEPTDGGPETGGAPGAGAVMTLTGSTNKPIQDSAARAVIVTVITGLLALSNSLTASLMSPAAGD